MTRAEPIFSMGVTLIHANAKSVLADGLEQIGAGATGVDCARLTRFDSSALAVLLAWRRAGRARGIEFEIKGLPAGLLSLTQAYGIDALL